MLVEEGIDPQQAETTATAAAVKAAAELWDDSDPAVRAVVKRRALALPDHNPREMKRFINLFRFYNFVAAPEWSRGVYPVVRQEVFEQVARIATLSRRWPFLLDLLGRPADRNTSPDSAADGNAPPRTMLEELEDAARNDTWDAALLQFEPPVPVEAWAAQLKELHGFLAEPHVPKIGSFARGFL